MPVGATPLASRGELNLKGDCRMVIKSARYDFGRMDRG